MISSLLLMLMMVMISTSGGRIHQEGTHIRGALSRGKHTHAHDSSEKFETTALRDSAFLSDSSHQFVRFDAPFHINIHHSHKLTLHRTALWSIVHTSPPLAKRGDVFSKGGKREKEGEGEKEKRNGKSGATTSTGLPVDSCLFSLLLPPLSRSSTTSFAPSRPPEPNYHTTWPQNRPIGAVPSPRPWWITMARMQHVSGAARSTAAGVATSCLASLFHCHRILYIHSLLIFNANCNPLFLDNTHLSLS